jgi:hypothetical protein
MTLNNNLSKEKKFIGFIGIDKFATYQVFAFVGVAIIIGTLIKLLGYANFSSDWFWLLAGVGLVIEGSISLVKQRRFDRKYKIIEREE